MATLLKTPGGKWKATVRRVGYPRINKTFRLKAEAEGWARKAEDAVAAGSYRIVRDGLHTSVAHALERYLKEVTPTKSPGTQRAERTHVHSLKADLGGYSLRTLTPAIIGQYRDKRLATVSERTNQPITPSTVRGELSLLGHLYKTAIQEWGINLASNPVSLIRRPRAAAGRTRRLVGDEEQRLLAAVDAYSNPMLGWIVRLALATAMRCGELVSLTADQVDLDKRVVRLLKTKNGSQRTVPLSMVATRLLSEALANPLRRGSPLVFPGEPGKDCQRRPYTFQKIWRNIVGALSIPDLRFHDLRHEAISRFVEKGLSDQEVMAISGHKSAQMLHRYAHLRAETLVDKLD
ncbi:MAG TPA: site-specific integrase [Nevskiaceae bacterium]|nr:site-specific integrase [Nevskiaceae bacterium]